MAQLKYERDAGTRDVLNMSKRGEFASHMVQWLNVVITRDVTNKS
jgi:hypothetical protein